MTNLVSIIIPCLNEEQHIGGVIQAIAMQTFPQKKMEIIIADGGSSDKTINIIQEAQQIYPELMIKIIENPARIIPAALNRAIKASEGEIIVRMDAHAIPDRQYIEYSVQNLQEKKGANVGGLWIIKPGNSTWIAKSIAFAASHPFGVGDAKYRYSLEPAYVDTVPFGAFNRSLFNQIGLYNEELMTNEDYELNMRIIKSGGKIYFDPKIKTEYYARSTLFALAKQYWRYGYWKFQMLRKYPDTIKFRQAIPPIFVLALIFLMILSVFINKIFFIFYLVLLVYGLTLIVGVVPIFMKQKKFYLFLGIPLAIITMHIFWGTGFLVSTLKKKQRI
ncbi:MAG: glycosyltransferase family 2 protein [Anaerolineaceae bacterium]